MFPAIEIIDDDKFKTHLVNFYKQQRGGAIDPITVFRGRAYQYGAGLGDVFGSLARFLVPIVGGATAHFIKQASEGIGEGKSVGESIKGSLLPALKSTFTTAGRKIVEKATTPQRALQSGSGRRRRRRGTKRKGARVYKGTRAKRSKATLFSPRFPENF